MASEKEGGGKKESENKGTIMFTHGELNSLKFKNILEQILLNNKIVLETNPIEGEYILRGVVNSKGEVHCSDKKVHFQVQAHIRLMQYTTLDCLLKCNVTEQQDKQIIVLISVLDTDKTLESLVYPLMPLVPNDRSYDPLKSLAAAIADNIRHVCTFPTSAESADLFGGGALADGDSSGDDTAPLDPNVPNLRW